MGRPSRAPGAVVRHMQEVQKTKGRAQKSSMAWGALEKTPKNTTGNFKRRAVVRGPPVLPQKALVRLDWKRCDPKLRAVARGPPVLPQKAIVKLDWRRCDPKQRAVVQPWPTFKPLTARAILSQFFGWAPCNDLPKGMQDQDRAGPCGG